MKLALFVCLMFATTTTLCEGGSFPKFWLQFFKKWIPAGTDVDVMMLLDSSGSVQQEGFNYGKRGIKITNRMINVRTPSGITGLQDGTRSGYIQFATTASIQIHLPDYNNVYTLNDEISLQIYTGGGTAIAEALILADEEFFDNNPNAGQPLRVLLVTDGEETQGGNPVQEAKKLRKKGVEICVVAIGNDVDLPVLNDIATWYPFFSKNPFRKWMRPCVASVGSWRQFYNGMKRAFKLLRKEKKAGRGN